MTKLQLEDVDLPARPPFRTLVVLTLLAVATGCTDYSEDGLDDAIIFDAAAESGEAVALWSPREPLPDAQELARARRDTLWRSAPSIDAVYRSDSLLPRSEDSMPYRPEPIDSFVPSTEYRPLSWISRWPGRAMADTTTAVGADTSAAADSAASTPSDSVLTRASDPTEDLRVPIGDGASGSSILYAQVLLDLARFSPGAIDGEWGKNTEQAVLWFQRAHGLPPTGQVDSATLSELVDAAGRPAFLRIAYTITEEDLSGEFQPLPDDVYAQDDLDCLCYESAIEALAERAHATHDLIATLNPGVSLDDLAPGDTLILPAVGEFSPTGGTAEAARMSTRSDSATAGAVSDSAAGRSGEIAEILVSDRGRYLHALDAAGRLLFHFPATLGGAYSPSPDEAIAIEGITFDPWFHYQPAILETVPDHEAETRLAPGPNSPVGVVWIALSKEHYGIHGTRAPETIGYAISSGCVRLTNWDAEFLAQHLQAGVPVRFIDIGGERQSP